MKKIWLGVSFLMMVSIFQPVMAKTVQVEALEGFSTAAPSQTMRVKIINNIQMDNDLTLFEGYVVTGKIINVTAPQRLKKNASFAFVPISYVNFQNESQQIKGEYLGKYTTTLNTAGLAKSAALGVGNYFVKGLSTGVTAVEGAVKNTEGNRLKSSAVALYDNSPISYVEKGEELVIKKNQIFYLNFKTKEEEPLESNYEYAPVNSQTVAPQGSGSISETVNKSEPIILKDDSIPKTSKDFPGEKLHSFDNSSNFNIPNKPVMEAEKIDNNINSLKRTPVNKND